MNALQTTTAQPLPTMSTARVPMVGMLRALLIAEAIAGFALAVYLSTVAAGLGQAGEESVRFAAGAAFLFAIFAAIASRGARRRRTWSWTMAAILQVLLAVGTGIAVMVAEWHPLFLVGFGAAAVVMLVLSTTAVRRALGQE
ncbi:MAG: hypothetical protein M3Y29_00735 [Chloroflexota bacterium]|jgi:peptidoglycan/LPS O-acetylase OafA/YrhL|nr:hypothetical protein [Chloroflexota bacterium]